jgi:hypothetical protein
MSGMDRVIEQKHKRLKKRCGYQQEFWYSGGLYM